LLLGVSIAAGGATISNLFIPLLFHTSEFSGYGPLFSIFMIGMIGHTIIRHRLLDIRVVIRRGVVYTCAMMVVALCFFVLVEGLHRLFGLGHDSIPLSEALIFALVVAISFQPVKGWLQNLLNAYLYRNTYDYQKTITEASRRLSTMLDLQPLVEYLVEVIDKTFHVEAIRVYLADQSERSLLLRLPRKGPEERLPIVVSALSYASPLVRFVQSQHQMLVREDASTERENGSLQAAARELADLSGDVALPLFHQHTVIGIIVIGAKRSGDPFFSDDLDLLSTLIGQAAIALNNAQLYHQVLLANEYVENILRTMDSGVITVDANGRVALCNSTAAQLTALSREHLMSLDIGQLPMSLGAQLKETLSDGRSRAQVEITLPAQGDRRTPLVCSTSALRDENGNILGALVVFSDLSKIKELENEKRRAERLASFGALVSGIAHEIKNPLVAIKTFAELLPERFSDTDFRDDFSKVVGTEIDRIDGLVARLRGLAAPTPDTLAPIDLREPISDTLSLLRAQLEHTQTTVDRDLGSSQALVAIDPSQAKQLFLNLFLNALEAMTPGGHLAVQILRFHRQGQSWIQVAVSDTGPGISDTIRAKVFEPFFTTKARGSGLGLAICRSITDAHRGAIRAETAVPGGGTTILVEFPAANLHARIEEQTLLRR
jgi:PAS domain S-box-containing protein